WAPAGTAHTAAVNRIDKVLRKLKWAISHPLPEALLLRLDPDLLQQCRVRLKVFLPRRDLVRAQNESCYIGVLPPAEVTRTVCRHGLAGPLEKVADAPAIPLFEEGVADQLGRILAP